MSFVRLYVDGRLLYNVSHCYNNKLYPDVVVLIIPFDHTDIGI